MYQSSNDNLQEEADWSQAAQKGDVQAFTNLITRYEKAVYNLCYRMLGNPNDAEDAAQEAFLRAYKAIDRYDPRRKFSTWVMSIASNYCIDQLRKRRMLVLSFDEMPFLDISDKSLGPEGRFVQEEMKREVDLLLEHLSGKDRAAVILRYWYEYSYDEIAAMLSLTNSAVKSRLHRARRSLARILETQQAQPVPAQDMLYETQTI